MKTFSLALLLILSIISCKDQKTTTDKKQVLLSSEILEPDQVEQVFTDSVKKELKLEYPIFRVYRYSDKSGEFLCVLTESNDSIDNETDTFSRSIKAVNLSVQKDKFQKVWEINDNIIENDHEENSIWFWTRFVDFKDFDKDSLIEPVIVYGTRGLNGYDDGRIKFVVFYKGKKYAIRHQNGVLDNQRETQVEDAFYTLPQILKDSINSKMNLMHEKEMGIFTQSL